MLRVCVQYTHTHYNMFVGLYHLLTLLMPTARSHTHSLVTSMYLHCLMQTAFPPHLTVLLSSWMIWLSPFVFTQVWFREGIYHHNPEGSLWEEVPLPGEVVQISCGPGDLVWAVLWEGQLIVREGIGRDCPKGTQTDWWDECVCVCLCLFFMEMLFSACQVHPGPWWTLLVLMWEPFM